MKTAYSYTRLSSAKQLSSSSTGEERQLKPFKQICKENGWNPSEKNFKDLGVSAFKGKNRLKGDLANFIKLAKGKGLGSNPILVLESFDRFSRQDIDESEPAILDLLKNDCDIFIAYSNKLFTKDATKDMVSRIEILVCLKQAYEFSKNLSKRLKAAAEIRKGKINEGAVMKIRHAPCYYSFNEHKKQYEQNEHSKTVADIIKMYLNGETIYGISNKLNKNNVRNFGYKLKTWSRQVVKDILTNPSIYGKFYENEKFFGNPITDKPTFDKLQVMIKRNSQNKGKFNSDYPNIFKGLCKCPQCNGSMTMGVERYHSKSGKLRAVPYRYLRCSSISNSKTCSNKHNMNLGWIEEEFFAAFLQKDPSEMLAIPKSENEQEIVKHQTEINIIDAKMNKLMELEDSPSMWDSVKSKLKHYQKQKDLHLSHIQDLNSQNIGKEVSTQSLNVFKSLFKKMRTDAYTWGTPNSDDAKLGKALDKLNEKLKDLNFRNQIKTLLPTLIKKIEFNTVRNEFKIYALSGDCIYTSLPN